MQCHAGFQQDEPDRVGATRRHDSAPGVLHAVPGVGARHTLRRKLCERAGAGIAPAAAESAATAPAEGFSAAAAPAEAPATTAAEGFAAAAFKSPAAASESPAPAPGKSAAAAAALRSTDGKPHQWTEPAAGSFLLP